MDKMKLAHEYMQNTLNLLRKHDIPYDFESLIEESFEYADAMQAEADKRKNTDRPKVLFEPKCEVDWSQAPKDATHYVIFADGLAYWYKSEKLECFDIAPSFGIVGMCVVERPYGL